MAIILSLPPELLTEIIDDLSTPDQQVQQEVDRDVTIIRPGYHALRQTCRFLRDFCMRHYQDSTELLVRSNKGTAPGLGGEGRRLATKMPVECTDKVMKSFNNHKISPIFQELNLDFADTAPNIVGRSVRWEILKSDVMKAFANWQVGHYNLKEVDCRRWSFKIEKAHLNFDVTCHYIPCESNAANEHLFCKTLVWTRDHHGTVELYNRCFWYTDRNSLNQPDCRCEADFVPLWRPITPTKNIRPTE